LLVTATAVGGPISITVTPSLAPNVYGSPSWATYVSNAVTAIENGFPSYGDPSSPTYYQQQTTEVTAMDLMVTGFPSWHGLADPGTLFGPNFASELGNRAHFGIDINGNGTKISISMLSFIAESDDPANILGFSFGLGSYNYSTSYVGIIYGVNGPTYLTSGPSTQLVDRIVGRGSGNALAAYCASCTVTEEQAAILAQLGYLSGATSFSGTYTMTDSSGNLLATGSGAFRIGPVPEPGTLAAIASGLALTGLLRRRHTSRGSSTEPREQR
jgi:hypothetical protein